MDQSGNFFDRVKHRAFDLKGKQGVLAEFLMTHYKSAAFMNSAQLARQAQVSEATVNRFANTIGYSGFTQMINDLRDLIQSELTTLDRVQEKLESTAQSPLERIVAEEQKSLHNLLESVKQEEIDQLIDLIDAADQIIILGSQISSSLASHFGYLLGKVTGKTQVVTYLSSDTHRLFNAVNQRTLVIPIAYPRYPSTIINLCAQFAHRGAAIVAITNSLLSPVVHYAKQSFLIPLSYVSMIDQFAPLMAFVETVILTYNIKHQDSVKKCLESFEDYVAKNKIFVTVESGKEQN